jgi:hypothetical protein
MLTVLKFHRLHLNFSDILSREYLFWFSLKNMTYVSENRSGLEPAAMKNFLISNRPPNSLSKSRAWVALIDR